MRLALPVATYQHRSRPASPARLLNCFVETMPEDARSPYILTRAPGAQQLAFVTLATTNNGPIQGIHAAHGVLYIICQGKLYSWDGTASQTGTLLGSVPSSSGNYDMDSNDTSLVVTTGGAEAYYYTPSGPTFGQITDDDFLAQGNVSEVEFLDNYLLFAKADSGVFFGADLGSATSFDALNFAEAEGFPDNIVGMKSDHRQLLLFGERTTEIWGNAGVSGFPFQRVPNGFIQVGCAAGRTVARLGSSVAWVADDLSVRVLEGVAATRISTHAIEQWLRTVTLSTGRASFYRQEGHVFYVLWFAEGTRVFDLTTGQWHERQSYGRDNWVWGFATEFDRNGVIDVIVGQAEVVYPSSQFDGAVIARLLPTYYLDYAPTNAVGGLSQQRMEWIYQPVYAEGRAAFHHRLEMMFESGVGLETDSEVFAEDLGGGVGQVVPTGSDPSVLLDYSDDGGKTWRSLPSKKLGKVGEYQKRVVWHALGSSRQRVYRASVSDPVPVTLIDTQLEVTGGRL